LVARELVLVALRTDPKTSLDDVNDRLRIGGVSVEPRASLEGEIAVVVGPSR